MGATKSPNFGDRVGNRMILPAWTCTLEICPEKKLSAQMGQNERNLVLEFPVAVPLTLSAFPASVGDSNKPRTLM
jgi:hypothetical protein